MAFARIVGLGIFAIFIILLATYFVLKHLNSERYLTRRAWDMPATPLFEAAEGARVKITGRVRCTDAPLQTPVSGSPCVYYHLVVDQPVGGTGPPMRTTLLEETRAQDIWIEEPSGARARVRLDKARIFANQYLDFTKEGSPTAPFETFLQNHSDATRKMLHKRKDVSATEYLLTEGREITVVGTIRRSGPPGSGAYRDEAGEIEIVGGRSKVLVISGGA